MELEYPIDIKSMFRDLSTETTRFKVEQPIDNFLFRTFKPFEPSENTNIEIVLPEGNKLELSIFGVVLARLDALDYCFWGFIRSEKQKGYIRGFFNPISKRGRYCPVEMASMDTKPTKSSRKFHSVITLIGMIKSVDSALNENRRLKVRVGDKTVEIQPVGFGHVTANCARIKHDLWFVGNVINGDDDGRIEGYLNTISGMGHYFYTKS